ncbi:MAG: deoxyribodipyrimidine photolyase [Pirellulales bacterium]
MPNPVPTSRIHAVVDRPPCQDARYVLYWMTAARRTTWNFGLQRAVEWSAELGRPLLVLEALRCGYRWASDRLHAFVLQGMADNERRLAGASVRYYPYVEPRPGAGTGLLERLAEDAAVVVTDEFPCFFLPRMVQAAAERVSTRMEQVDSNGLLPLRAADHAFPTAYAFRRFLQKTLPEHLPNMPLADPLKGLSLPAAVIPREVLTRWPRAAPEILSGETAMLSQLPIDHAVGPAIMRGGSEAAGRCVTVFLKQRLGRYSDDRNEPAAEATSGFSPYLHFGHLSSHEVFSRIIAQEDWTPEQLGPKAAGQREGWWGMSPSAEGFLDQLITWRELGYNFCHHRPDDYGQYKSLPDWAQKTLDKHATDTRPTLYSLEELEQARTHDALWNAAQRQLLREGRMHNYLRMLWGKKILEWSPSPAEALDVLIELNNKYAVDGRNPNSYSGIFWTLGRYDRPWGPERPIFGTIRYMSSDNTARKLDVKGYLARYGKAEGERRKDEG